MTVRLAVFRKFVRDIVRNLPAVPSGADLFSATLILPIPKAVLPNNHAEIKRTALARDAWTDPFGASNFLD
jgi:hypothetical protein